MRKPKPIGPLSSLTPDQRQTLRAWCDYLTYEQIQQRLALPPPDGFGLQVSVWQLRRYYQRLALDHPIDPALAADAPSLAAHLDQLATQDTPFSDATQFLFEKRVFQMAVAGEDIQTIKPLFGALCRSRDLNLRQRYETIRQDQLELRHRCANLRERELALKNAAANRARPPTS